MTQVTLCYQSPLFVCNFCSDKNYLAILTASVVNEEYAILIVNFTAFVSSFHGSQIFKLKQNLKAIFCSPGYITGNISLY